MKRSIYLFLLLFMTNSVDAQVFKSQQLQYERVRNAYSKKESTLLNRYKSAGIATLSTSILIRAFKESSELELWAMDKKTAKFTLIHTYEICTKSGELGPKRASGDQQVPEGFYTIQRFNPMSSFYLSLGINYPNTSDRILGNQAHLGGDIFIHGNCMTIGCIPITDAYIMELYIACVEAKNGGQKEIPVHIFPYRMDLTLHEKWQNQYKKESKTARFWENIKQGYDFFEKNKTLPIISVDKQGLYHFK